MKHHLRNLSIVWFIVVTIPFPLVIIFNHGMLDTPSHILAYDLGIFAYVWWLVGIFMATRPKWLEHFLGLPSIYFIHGFLGVLAILAATWHKFNLFSMFPLIKETGNYAWYLELFLMLYAILFLSGWLIDRFKIFRQIKMFLEHHGISHQFTIWVHRLNFIVVGLIWLHVYLIPRLSMLPYFRVLFNAYTVLFLIAYIWQKLWTKYTNNTATVIENQQINNNLQRITLKLNQNISFQAGDFFFIKSLQKGISHEAHPFSIISSPKDNADKLTFVIHKLGDYTNQLTQLQLNSKVHLEGPFGYFNQIVEKTNEPILLYGLGSGITPLISLAQQYSQNRSIQLIWSAGNFGSNEYFKQLLKKLENDEIKVNVSDHHFSEAELTQIIPHQTINRGQVIIVGSSLVVLKVSRLLHKIGFKWKQLNNERITM